MYRELASVYDVMYSEKDYEAEVETLLQVIQSRKKSKGRLLLDVACGTGSHLEYFKKHYVVTGLDTSPNMLVLARLKQPDVQFIEADMTSFDLEYRYDVITCLFGSINYLTNRQALHRTVENFAKCLERGGVIAIEPLFLRENFRPGHASLTCFDGEESKVARLCVSIPEGEGVNLDFHYLLTDGMAVRYIHDPHHMMLFSAKEIMDALTAADLQGSFIPSILGRDGVFIGAK